MVRAKQRHTTVKEALNRALESHENLAQRQLVLRFIARVEADPSLREWAEGELKAVDKELLDARNRLEHVEKLNIEMQTELNAARRRIDDLGQSDAKSSVNLRATQQRILGMQEKLRKLEAEKKKLERRTSPEETEPNPVLPLLRVLEPNADEANRLSQKAIRLYDANPKSRAFIETLASLSTAISQLAVDIRLMSNLATGRAQRKLAP